MRKGRKIPLLCVITLTALFLLSCASASVSTGSRLASDTVLLPVGLENEPPAGAGSILAQVAERNRTVEDDPEWIERSYSGLLIRRLSNISPKEYADYSGYLDNGVVYVLVHPAYFTFFHYPKKMTSDNPKKNAVELLIESPPPDREFEVLQAQERRTRDFLEYKSTEEKLVILVLPKNYANYSGYAYRRGQDEYMRFLNESTNFSKSVLFVESRSANRGYLTEEDSVRLMEFILSVGAKKVYIGGGYIGRCLEDFYALVVEEYGREGIFIVPELSDISPREITGSLARAILRPDGTIDPVVATKFMRRDEYNVQEIKPDLINLIP